MQANTTSVPIAVSEAPMLHLCKVATGMNAITPMLDMSDMSDLEIVF